ncbi:MAG: hypothetical protein JSW60_04045 [Thermoplasmatales archaeon]|nr:MAG: hypothetical protein JSW60_04045 [Thermoplasmatales archaeon]
MNNILFTVKNMVFSKKPVLQEKSKEKSIDLHLEIINKIDKLLEEHKNDIFSRKSNTKQEICISDKELPVEMRPSLSRKIGVSGFKMERKPDDIFTTNETILDRFKSDFSGTDSPDFKFVSDLHFADNAPQIKKTVDEHIEVIDLCSLPQGEVTLQTKSTFLTNDDNRMKKQTSERPENRLDSHKILGKKVEVINTKEFGDKICDKVSTMTLKQSEKSEEKKQVYYLHNMRQQKEGRFKESGSEELFNSVNFEKKIRTLEEREEELKRKKKELKKKEKEAEKLKKLEAKKAVLEAREKERDARSAEREKKAELNKKEREQRAREKEELRIKRKEAKKALTATREKERRKKRAEEERNAELKRKEKVQKLKEIEAAEQESVFPTKSISETEELTEWASLDVEEVAARKPVSEERAKGEIIESPEKTKGEKPFDEDREKISEEKEEGARMTEKEMKEEIKRLEHEQRVKERKEQRLKKIEEKKAEKEKKRKLREKQAEIKRQEREQRAKEKEVREPKKFASKKHKTGQKKKKPLIFFKKEKEKKEEYPEADKKPEPTLLDEDVKKLLVITDNLLGELPEEVIDKFAQSEDFELYSKVLHKYKIK